MNLITNLFEFRNRRGNNIENPFGRRQAKTKNDDDDDSEEKNTFTIE